MQFGDYNKRLREDTKLFTEYNKRVSRTIICKTKCGIKLTPNSRKILGVIIEDAEGNELYIKYSVMNNFYNNGVVALTNDIYQALSINFIKAVANCKI